MIFIELRYVQGVRKRKKIGAALSENVDKVNVLTHVWSVEIKTAQIIKNSYIR